MELVLHLARFHRSVLYFGIPVCSRISLVPTYRLVMYSLVVLMFLQFSCPHSNQPARVTPAARKCTHSVSIVHRVQGKPVNVGVDEGHVVACRLLYTQRAGYPRRWKYTHWRIENPQPSRSGTLTVALLRSQYNMDKRDVDMDGATVGEAGINHDCAGSSSDRIRSYAL